MQLSLRCRRRQQRQRQTTATTTPTLTSAELATQSVGACGYTCACVRVYVYCVCVCACFDCLRECVGGAKNNKIKNTKIVGDDFRSLDKPPLQKQQEQQVIAKSKCNK